MSAQPKDEKPFDPLDLVNISDEVKEQIRADVAAAPPLSPETAAKIRRIFRSARSRSHAL